MLCVSFLQPKSSSFDMLLWLSPASALILPISLGAQCNWFPCDYPVVRNAWQVLLVHRWPIVFFFLRSMIITSHSPMDRPPRLHLNHRIYILLLWQHCILTTSLPGLNFFLDLLSLLVIIWLCFSACHLLFIFCSKFVLYVSTKLLKNDMFY